MTDAREKYKKEMAFFHSEEALRLYRGFSLDDVCRYHREQGGVLCDQRKRTDEDCRNCGWNPAVSRRRLRKIIRKMEEQSQWL